MKILFLGEIVGRCGIGTIKFGLKKFRNDHNIDLVIANGEGATSGFGLGFQNALSLNRMGIDVLTMGEKSFYKIDMLEGITKKGNILRPANYPDTVPGRGLRLLSCGETKVYIINTLGMFGFTTPHLNNPFLNAEALVEKAKQETPIVLYIFHAAATAEKIAMGRLLQGKASVVVGTHSKVLTADAEILPGGTAYITDLGRCGASVSVGGFAPESEIRKLRTQVMVRSMESWVRPQLQGLLVTIDPTTGCATDITTVREDVAVDPLPQTQKEPLAGSAASATVSSSAVPSAAQQSKED